MSLDVKLTLSVIIPCYKVNENYQYLNELLNSIIFQKESIFQIIQIILINDSPELNLISYIEPVYHTKILILNNKINSGQAFSRNKGSQFAIGEYLHFIDQDDIIAIDYYKSIIEIKDIIISNCYLFKNNNYVRLYKFHRILIYKFLNKINYLKFFLIFDNIILSPGQAIFKKEIFIKLKGFPVLDKYGSDDYGLMFNFAKNNFNYNFYPEAIFFHRLHPSQGKQHLNMDESKKNFFLTVYPKTTFSKLCNNDFVIIKFMKKITYVFFNNRIF